LQIITGSKNIRVGTFVAIKVINKSFLSIVVPIALKNDTTDISKNNPGIIKTVLLSFFIDKYTCKINNNTKENIVPMINILYLPILFISLYNYFHQKATRIPYPVAPI
jgi:hypothetical protein